jgi:hypothetical protein
MASVNANMKLAPLDAFSRLRMVSLVTRSVPASPFWRLWMRPVSSRRLSSPDQRLDILKFDPKNGDVIGTSHIASLTASALRGNRSPSAVFSLPADFSLAPKVLDQCLEVRKRYPVSSSP